MVFVVVVLLLAFQAFKDLLMREFGSFAVLAESRKAFSVGAPLLPTLRGFPPRLWRALIFAYSPCFIS
jgi:hypothetical protein